MSGTGYVKAGMEECRGTCNASYLGTGQTCTGNFEPFFLCKISPFGSLVNPAEKPTSWSDIFKMTMNTFLVERAVTNMQLAQICSVPLHAFVTLATWDLFMYYNQQVVLYNIL